MAIIALSFNPITGQVVSTDGKPISSALVGTTFRLAKDTTPAAQIGYGDDPIKTDANGTFSIDPNLVYNGLLVAQSPSGEVGFTPLAPGAKSIKIVVAPTADLQILAAKSGQTSKDGISFTLFSGKNALGYFSGTWGTTSVRLPAGDLTLSAFEVQSQAVSQKLTVKAGKTSQLKLSLPASKWVELIGKPAPKFGFESAYPQSSRLTNDGLKGKWVLLDFWATWCGPCVEEFPNYFEFYKRNWVHRDQFEIIGVHSPDGLSYSAIEPKLRSLIADKWKGVSPPFPLAFDASGGIHKRFGIEVYPTTLLIDPQGRVVGPSTIEELEKRLNLTAEQR